MSDDPELYRWFPDGLPDDILDLDDIGVLHALGEPTLIRVPGRGEQSARAIATLLHGNENTGFHAVLRTLRRRNTYPFDLYVLLGNVRAALEGEGFAHRFLDGQEDFNRVWGLNAPTTAMRIAADAMLARLHAAKLESLVDIHNNSGDNPFYAIATDLEPRTLNLATIFTTTILHWELTAATLMEALDDDCTAIAVECGLPSEPASLAFAVDGIRRYLGSPPLQGEHLVRDFDLLAGMRKVVVRPEVRFQFGGDLGDGIDFVILEDADVHNFVLVPAGHVFGRVLPGAMVPLLATDATGADVTDEFFAVVDGVVVMRQQGMPVMMTQNIEAARKDCLFYLADAMPPPRL